MSHSSFFGVSRSGLGLLADVAGQVLVAAAAAAGVMAVAGCSSRAAQPPVAMAAPPAATPDPRAAATPPAMSSALSAPADAALFDTPASPAAGQGDVWTSSPRAAGNAAGPAGGATSSRQATDPAATARERKRARQAEVDALIAEAAIPPAGPAARGSVALRAADRAIAPLADTLAAIDAAQRVVVENLRNTEVTGFKASRTACGDGRDVASQLDTSHGEMQATHRLLDVAVRGDGFLQIQVYTPERPAGAVGFTRNGRLYVSPKDGTLVVGKEDGWKVIPPIAVPVGTTELKVEPDGTVRITQAGAEKPAPQAIGRLTLVRFTDPSALQPLGGGVYGESESSGAAVESGGGERGAGTFVQGFLEASNVDLVRERMRMRFLQTWRATVLAALDGEADPVPADDAVTGVGRKPRPAAAPAGTAAGK
jgi:flagellar basal body rod protein FlgG